MKCLFGIIAVLSMVTILFYPKPVSELQISEPFISGPVLADDIRYQNDLRKVPSEIISEKTSNEGFYEEYMFYADYTNEYSVIHVDNPDYADESVRLKTADLFTVDDAENQVNFGRMTETEFAVRFSPAFR